jgi:glycosyltransferase involved in cell wall biosynthesis
MEKSHSFSIIIPVYRSANILPELCDRIFRCFPSDPIEVILIEDRGGDHSWDVILSLSEKNSRIRGFRMSRNYGQHNAILCGIRNARHELIITMDDDLQHPPEELHKLIQKIDEGYDVVYGSPIKEQHGLWRDLASRITKIALHSTIGAENARNVSAFRVLRTRLRDGFSEYKAPSVHIDVLLTWATTSFTSVRVRHDERKAGISGYTAKKLIRHALNMMTGYSTFPLQLASILGFVISAFGMLILVYVLALYAWRGVAVPGFYFITSIISIFSGTQLIVLGIFGEYLSRMYVKSMDRPAYIVSHESNTAQP